MEKINCPECETEIVPEEGKAPAKCPKCSFPLAAYAPLVRILDAWEKGKKKAQPKKKNDDDDSILGALANL